MNNMEINTAARLIAILLKENKSNTPEERDFNLKWIELLKKAMIRATHKPGFLDLITSK